MRWSAGQIDRAVLFMLKPRIVVAGRQLPADGEAGYAVKLLANHSLRSDEEKREMLSNSGEVYNHL
jgi:hypothetical protein